MRKTTTRPPSRATATPAWPPKGTARRGRLGVAAAVPVRPPAPGEGKRGEDGHLAYLLRQAQAAARLSLDRALASTGLTHPQFVVLTMLKAYPGLSGADLARVALLTPQTVNVIIGNLERDGAIRRTPHPVHGRVLQSSLTRRGLALLATARRRATALDQRLAGGLNERELATIRRWLARLAAEFHQD
ncbi:MarR family transcriptional regulator [Bradyrhizobium ontarionense]|uniref:MarR family transcriptional regulator n=1 Tax=Bradyrhizobium ontarionense TaxID=2898149 RepID=A0ABY3RE43_9BRAD|nr:MarR family transcriptional regulator [Bradyrhizobium sp. A19]UFZ05563.1 MarR family transcriptional regulator [Bradyrhizobium sp. A19]